MNYREEQALELEALSSIYPSELTLLDSDSCPSFKILVSSSNIETEPDIGISTELVVEFPEQYPEQIPRLSLDNSLNCTDDEALVLLDQLNQEAESQIGMAMIFTLVSSLQERLNDLVEEEKTRRQMEKEREFREQEELDRKKMEGTLVNIETFLAWKTKFDEEMNALKKKKAETASKRLTGRQQFLNDANLNISDLQLIQDEGDMKIDESLFQDLDDLDLDEDDED